MVRGSKSAQVPFHVRRTTLLPSSLREELVLAGKLDAPQTSNKSLKSTSIFGRKQRRKDERKGVNKRASNSSSGLHQDTKTRNKGKQRETIPTEQKIAKEPFPADLSQDEAARSKKRKRATTSQPQTDPKEHSQSMQRRKIAADQTTPLQRLLDKTSSGSSSSNKSIAIPKFGRTDAEVDEDAEIAWLEAKLGRGRNESARKEIQEDGLDGESPRLRRPWSYFTGLK